MSVDVESLSLFHTTDLHGNYETIGRFSGKTGDALVFDSGDAIRGSNIFFHFEEPVFSVMNSAGYDAMAVGNREFSYFFRVFEKRLEAIRFPVVSANLEDVRGRLSDCLKPYVMIAHRGLKIAVTGLSPIQYPETSFLARATGLVFHPYVDSIKRIFSNKEVSGADLFILLSHAGIDEDFAIASVCPEIDVILGGHSHLCFRSPVVKNGVYICQSGSHGRFYSKYVFDYLSGEICNFSVKHVWR